MKSVIDFLRSHAPFDRMEEAHLSLLADRLRSAVYAADTVLIGPESARADRLYIIQSGSVRGESPDDASSLWELAPGEMFPIGALLSGRSVRSRYKAVGRVEALELDAASFASLLQASVVFSDFCSRRLASLLDQTLARTRADTAANLGRDNALEVPLSACLRRTPVTCSQKDPLRSVLQTMRAENIGSMVMVDDAGRPAGVFTLRDLLSRVALGGYDLDKPVEGVMTADPVTLNASAFAFEAAVLMADHGFHHLCVVDDAGRLKGVISEGDLFSLQRVSLANLSRTIRHADSIAALAALRGDIQTLIGQMIAQGVQIDQITRLITLLNDHLTRRVIDLTLQERGDPGIVFDWLSFGSEGRGEQTLKTDQDNGILFELPEGLSAEEARARLLPLAKAVNDALALCGFPLCEGNIMASNPECCLSFEEWQKRFSRWIDQGTPEHLLKSSIFFDFRVLWGDESKADRLREWLLQACAKNPRFLKQMAATALACRPPLGLLGDFKLSGKGDHEGQIDLKKSAITPFVDAARILALASGIPQTGTSERFEAAAQKGALKPADVQSWLSAYRFIQLIRIQSHREQALANRPMSNHIDPRSLSDLEQRILKEAFRQIRKLQSLLEVRYQL